MDSKLLLMIVERVKRMFDVAADPRTIATQLSVDPLLKRAVAAHDGIRVPGAWDGFELAVRAILGQQISVRAATTIAGRVAIRWGAPFVGGGGLSRLFPSPVALADARLEEAGVVGTRASTIRALARAVRDDRLVFETSSCLTALREIPGIGDWTAQYVAIRALSEPDAFPSSDLILRRMSGDRSRRELETRSQHWRPWRAYAAMLLWQTAADHHDSLRRTPYAQLESSRRRNSGRGTGMVGSTAR